MDNAAQATRSLRALATAALFVVLAQGVRAQEAAPSPTTVCVSLKDGKTFVGTITGEDESHITLRSELGIEVRIPRSAVASIREALNPTDRFPRRDPNDSRLMFAPTGRPLRKGDGYFSDHYVVFPGVTYGITNHVSVAGGVSMVPAVGLSDQVFFASARLAHQPSDRLALATGALYAAGAGEAAAMVFGVGTVGRPEHSLSVGLGFGGTRQEGDYPDYRRRFRWRDAPILMVGGNLQLSNSVTLVSENWLLLGRDFELSRQPFGLALRFFGERISADVGVVFVGEILKEGLPIPWLSVSYHFGPSRRLPVAQRRR
jgi:hypothetical protein